MTYSIEIELPRSGSWFRYFTNVDTIEEAQDITQAASDNQIKARIQENS